MSEPTDVKPVVTPPASSAGTNNAPDPTSGAPADNGSNVDDLDKPVIPRRRLNEELEEKKHYKSLAEEYRQKAESLQQEIEAGRKPPAADPVDDILTDPNGFVKRRFDNEVGSLKQDVTDLKRERIENVIGEQYAKDTVMQKMYKDKKELFSAIGKTAAKYGAKELTPQTIHAAYQQLIVDNLDTITKTSREMGIEEERAKSRALDGSTVPFGNSAGTVKSTKPTEADLKVWKKMGRNVEEMTKKLENAEVDERGIRRLIRGGKNGKA